MSNGLTGPSKQPNESRLTVAKWLTLLAAHFRVELSETEIRIYCDSLQNENQQRLELALQRCLHECMFMPHVSEVRQRLPEAMESSFGKHYYEGEPGSFVPVKDWYEPNSPTGKLHIWEDAHGNRRAAYVKLKPGELPPKMAPCPPEDYMTWEQMLEKFRTTVAKTAFVAPSARLKADEASMTAEDRQRIAEQIKTLKQRFPNDFPSAE